MLRRPFDIENGITGESRSLKGSEELAFEESFGDPSQSRLERVGELQPRTRILVALAVLLVAVLAGRLYFLAFHKHGELRAIADDNRLRIEYLAAPRGAIYDRSGNVIAGNRPGFELAALPLDLPEDEPARESVIVRIAEIAGRSVEEIKNQLQSGQEQLFQSILIEPDLSREQALILREQEESLPGFRVVSVPIREYSNPAAYAHVLGYVGKVSAAEYEVKQADGYLFNDSVGKTGIEAVYEPYLRGSFGERQVEVDARGVIKKVYGEKQAVPGQTAVLNIDGELQEKVYEVLGSVLAASGKKRAAAIAMEPKSGRVLAYVVLPGFDGNKFAAGIDAREYDRLIADPNQPLFNRGVAGLYPPGSTVKPMVAVAALQEAVVTPQTVVNDQGFIVIENIYGGPDAYYYGFNRRALGRVEVKRAIALSSDIYFYTAGGGYEPYGVSGLGISKLSEYYRQFHLGSSLGIDLPGEQGGLVPTPEWKEQRYPDSPLAARWYLGDTYNVSIGQGDLLVTPLQVLSWTATVANNGKIMKPFIVDRVESSEGEIVLRQQPEVLGEVKAEQKYFDLVQEGMRLTVTEGTARQLANLRLPVAAKTGTAQFDARDPNRAHGWFAGYAPYDDPEIAIVVLVEDGGVGGTTAVPIAKQIFEWWQDNRWQN